MKKPATAFLLIAILLTSNGGTEPLSLVTMDYPPHAFQEAGTHKGFQIDILREAFKRMEQPITIKTYPWARVLHMMKKGYADGVIGAYKTPEREQFMDYPRHPINYGILSLFVLKDSPITFNGDLRALRNYRFCVVRGFSYGNTFDTAVRDRTIIHLREAPSIEENIEAFLALDLKTLLITEKYSCFYQLSRLGKVNAVRELPGTLGKIPAYIAFSKKRHRVTVIEKLDRILARMHADGTITAMMRRYLPKQ